MLPLRNPPKDRTMLGDRLTLFLMLTIFSVSNAVVVFELPPSGGAIITFPEDTAPGAVLYSLHATDTEGNVPVFGLNFNCEESSTHNQSFTINQFDQLLVPTEGFDAESCTRFIFTFTVTAGASHATSDPLTVIVTDINDNPPQFTKLIFYGEVWKNDEQGSSVNINDTIYATDPDKSNLTITYTIAGAQTTFAFNVTTGTVYVANPSRLAALASPKLTIQATDGGLMSTATLSITVHDDPCTITPCQNGGSCISTKDARACICLSGYLGVDCEKVNYCFVNYCQNDGTCTSLDSDYSCICVPNKGGKNCTDHIIHTMITTATRSTTTTTSILTRTTPSQPTASSSNAQTTTSSTTPYQPTASASNDACLGLGIGLPVACAITIIGTTTRFA